MGAKIIHAFRKVVCIVAILSITITQGAAEVIAYGTAVKFKA